MLMLCMFKTALYADFCRYRKGKMSSPLTTLFVLLQSLTNITCMENNIQSNDSRLINQNPADLALKEASVLNARIPTSNQEGNGKITIP